MAWLVTPSIAHHGLLNALQPPPPSQPCQKRDELIGCISGADKLQPRDCPDQWAVLCLGWPQALLRHLADLSFVLWNKEPLLLLQAKGCPLRWGTVESQQANPNLARTTQDDLSIPKTTQTYP